MWDVVLELVPLVGDEEGIPVGTVLDAVTARMPADPEAARDRRREYALRALQRLAEQGFVRIADGERVLL